MVMICVWALATTSYVVMGLLLPACPGVVGSIHALTWSPCRAMCSSTRSAR